MAGQAGPIADEQHGVLRLTAYGLTDEQARATPSASPLSVGGLIKHCASTEEGWISLVRGEEQVVDYAAYDANFALADGETLDQVLDRYDRVAELTEKTIVELADLDRQIPIDHSVPWNSKDMDHWTVRWILLHLITETARHTGHADIIRETVDGGTAFPLLAAAEGWPETDWIKPWKPAAS